MTSSFTDLPLAEPIRRALGEQGYRVPTAIQAQAIPALVAGRDLVGLAQTGTGKTAAFALPVLERLANGGAAPGPRAPRALVLTPTRELAVQVGESFRAYGRHLRLRSTTVFGGVGIRPQIETLRRGVDILVATPGRLLDLHSQGHCRLDRIEVLVLDEADRMLDMGFIRDLRRIIALLPRQRQTVLFSATMPTEVARLAEGVLTNPVRVATTPSTPAVERIDQRVLFVDHADKRSLLTDLLRDPAVERAIVFTRTKHGANRVAEHLDRVRIAATAIHGNKSQGARQRALEAFRTGAIRVLVATDVAARGIDVDGVTHVFNFELPHEPESYVHRIGRTGRMGASGTALSLCDRDERPLLRDIERLTRRPIEVVRDHPYAVRTAAAPGQPQPKPEPARPRAARPPVAQARGRRRRDRRRGPDVRQVA